MDAYWLNAKGGAGEAVDGLGSWRPYKRTSAGSLDPVEQMEAFRRFGRGLAPKNPHAYTSTRSQSIARLFCIAAHASSSKNRVDLLEWEENAMLGTSAYYPKERSLGDMDTEVFRAWIDDLKTQEPWVARRCTKQAWEAAKVNWSGNRLAYAGGDAGFKSVPCRMHSPCHIVMSDARPCHSVPCRTAHSP